MSAAPSKHIKKPRFNTKAEVWRIKCDGIVKGMPTSQTNRSKGHEAKVVDPNYLLTKEWLDEVKIHEARARAKGILLDQSNEYAHIEEVHLIIGPDHDCIISVNDNIKYDSDREQMFIEQLVDHDVIGNLETPIECAYRCLLNPGIGDSSWIQVVATTSSRTDGLSGWDWSSLTALLHIPHCQRIYQRKPSSEGTAKGGCQPYVLGDTPSVLSMGKRCMQEGYSFIWLRGKDPFLVDQDGRRIDPTMHDLIPRMDLGTDEGKPYEDTLARRIIQMVENQRKMDDSTISPNSNRLYIDSESGDEY